VLQVKTMDIDMNTFKVFKINLSQLDRHYRVDICTLC
jgi:hypothetical protein